jgi:hypothetical protein
MRSIELFGNKVAPVVHTKFYRLFRGDYQQPKHLLMNVNNQTAACLAVTALNLLEAIENAIKRIKSNTTNCGESKPNCILLRPLIESVLKKRGQGFGRYSKQTGDRVETSCILARLFFDFPSAATEPRPNTSRTLAEQNPHFVEHLSNSTRTLVEQQSKRTRTSVEQGSNQSRTCPELVCCVLYGKSFTESE